ncbi:wd repeat-containing protein [Anaeramoeba flamelloides]|uniref:Wd repeat-containing protein n=1 Tax=Anaeramoeba flamelloides TaxID=1746091 RepID=A0AAV7ZHG4_9EUKA|nr:wd repeat-containing protein [Anaeramoeba flamelloides]
MSRDHERYGFQFKLFELFGEIDKEFTLLHEENVLLRTKLGLPTRELPKATKSLKGRVGRLVSSITTSVHSQWYVSGQITAHQDINWSLQSHPELPTVFVTGSSDKTSRVFDRLNKQCYLYSGHKGTVNNVRFHPNWKVLYCCSSSGDRTCHIWPYQLSSFNDNCGNYQNQKNLYSIQTNRKKTPNKMYQKEKRNRSQKSKDRERKSLNVKTKNIQPITPRVTSKKSDEFDDNYNFKSIFKSSSLNKLDYLPIKEKIHKNLHDHKNNLKQSKNSQNENLLGNSFEISRSNQKQNSEFETKIEDNNPRFKPHVPNQQKRQSNEHNSPVYERIERLKSIWPSDLLTEDEDDNFLYEKNMNKIEQSNHTNSPFNIQRRLEKTNLTNENNKSQRLDKTTNNKTNEKNKNKNQNMNKNKKKKKIEKGGSINTNSEKENAKNKKTKKTKEKESNSIKNKNLMKQKNKHDNKVNNNLKRINSEQTSMFDKKKNPKYQQLLSKIKSEKRKINKNSQSNKNASSRKYSYPPFNLEVDQNDLISSFNKNKINKFNSNKHNNNNNNSTIDYDDDDDDDDNDDDYSNEVDISDNDDNDEDNDGKGNEEYNENAQTNINNHLNIDQESIISNQTSPLSKSIHPNILSYNKSRIINENTSDYSIKRGHQPAVILKGHASIVSFADWVTTHSMINVVTGSDDNTVKLWNIENSSHGKLLSTLTAHDNAITHVSTHSSEPLILSSSLDSTFRLWDLRSSKNNVRLFKSHSAAVRSAIFSKNSNIIVSASDDRTGKIWDIRNSNHPLHSFNCSSGINKISISPRYGKIIAPLDNSTARIYDQNGKLVSQLKSKEFGHHKMITAADWTCDEKNILTTGIDHKIIVWSPPLKKKY